MLGNDGLSIFGTDRTGRNILTGVNTPGKVFYVDTAANGGSDSNSGLSPDDPVLKINYAMDLVTANKGDVIQILGNSPSSPNDTAEVIMDVAGVTLRGLYGRGLLSDSGFAAFAQDTPTITVSANYCTVENLYLGCHSSDTTGGIIEFGLGSWSFTLRNCLLDTQYAPAYGLLATVGQNYPLIEDCTFGRSNIAGYTSACIEMSHTIGGVFRRNNFYVTGIGMNIAGGASGGWVLDNNFMLPSNTKGKAITVTASTGKWFFSGNVANYGKTDMGQNPYLDAGDAANTWGLNYKGVTATLPATS